MILTPPILSPPYQTRTLINRRGWKSDEKEWVFLSCEKRCFYCGAGLAESLYGKRIIQKGYRGWEVDHNRALSDNIHFRGGPNHYLNLVASCWQCNNSKLERKSNEFWWEELGLRPRCLGIKGNGLRCELKVNKSKQKYCHFHNAMTGPPPKNKC